MPKGPPKAKRVTAPSVKRDWASSKGKRLTGWANTKARRELFHSEPLCRECFKNGRMVIATIRDHIVALAFGGKEEPSNVQPLCAECHDAKSKREAAEGARRHRGGGFVSR